MAGDYRTFGGNITARFRLYRATLKLLFVGALSLAMLIPLLMVRSIVSERQDLQLAAENTIANRWGGPQSIGGLVALTRAPVKASYNNQPVARNDWRASVLSDLEIKVSLVTEQRYLGIYEVPVYTTRVLIEGRLDWQHLSSLQAPGDLVLWLPLSDVRGVREISSLKLGSLEIPARPLGIHANTISGLQFTVAAQDRQDLEAAAVDKYRLELKLAGSGSLMFLPLADTTHVTLDADWPHPEFVGQYLPTERSISASGVQASWQLLGLNRPYGDQWVVAGMPFEQLNQAGFGMRLETPVDGYQRSERSVKYGFLFISLTFFTLFLFEVMTGRPLHPVPYVLTGAALAVFYLVGAMMAVTYSLLYVLVSAQHAALLLGSLALLLAIAGLMYLTRGVDWYAYGGEL